MRHMIRYSPFGDNVLAECACGNFSGVFSDKLQAARTYVAHVIDSRKTVEDEAKFVAAERRSGSHAAGARAAEVIWGS